MRSLTEAHDPRDLLPGDPDAVEKISRFLMLKEGKLVDELDTTDEDIREWVVRLADIDAQRKEWTQHIEEVRELADQVSSPADRRALEFIEGMVAEGFDERQALHSQELLRSGYMDHRVEL